MTVHIVYTSLNRTFGLLFIVSAAYCAHLCSLLCPHLLFIVPTPQFTVPTLKLIIFFSQEFLLEAPFLHSWDFTVFFTTVSVAAWFCRSWLGSAVANLFVCPPLQFIMPTSAVYYAHLYSLLCPPLQFIVQTSAVYCAHLCSLLCPPLQFIMSTFAVIVLTSAFYCAHFCSL